ncbi:Methyltransferase type 12 [Candidatus Sulfopaludibacter sp. SbA3]|nr:Methyltransferase type 12 [Candidatus Sulfopaludibacter sp. SbA3]
MGEYGIVSDVPVLIPAYKPGAALVALVSELLQRGVEAIIVVNDGSGPEFDGCFHAIAGRSGVHVLHHAVNLGKGAALKTGMNHALVHFPKCLGVVTADADGQHCSGDILSVAAGLRENAGALIIGVRTFDRAVPWKSRVGNNVTRALMRLMVGQNLSDTQTGLRGVPSSLIPHLLRVPTSGYEFELDMLMACKHQGCPVVEVPIRTIYVNDNRGSHFHPISDSMRIYFLLLRFSVLSLLTAVLDNVVFAFLYAATASIGESQITGRLVAMIFNYLGARSVVFQSQQKHAIVFPKYVSLVVCNGLVSYILIQFLHFRMGVSTVPAKLIAEGLLFIANFAIQRDFVFTRTKREPAKQATDWDRYYTSVPFTAKLTRRYSTAVLLDAMRRYVCRAPSVVEIGGANSCFMDAILSRIRPRSYDVIDTNRYGLSLLEKRAWQQVRLHEQSVLHLAMDLEADLVFSVGLVEHFDPAETRRAVLAHFDILRSGGVAIITFPTPTLLYRAARAAIGAVRMWKFPDERPLMPSEVLAAVAERGEILEQKTLWPLILTQHIIVARKGLA